LRTEKAETERDAIVVSVDVEDKKNVGRETRGGKEKQGEATHPISVRQSLRTVLDRMLKDPSEPICVEDLTCLEELREGPASEERIRSGVRNDESERK